MNAEILPRGLAFPSPCGGQAIYKRFHIPKSCDISAMKKTDINFWEFIRAAGVYEIFISEGKARARPTQVFLGIFTGIENDLLRQDLIMKFTLDINRS